MSEKGRLVLARCLLATGQQQQAREEAAKILARQPEHGAAKRLLAEIDKVSPAALPAASPSALPRFACGFAGGFACGFACSIAFSFVLDYVRGCSCGCSRRTCPAGRARNSCASRACGTKTRADAGSSHSTAAGENSFDR